jgi:hypothetical protein
MIHARASKVSNVWQEIGDTRAKRRYGVDFLPAAATELGSGQPFLRFFQVDREGHERGVLSLEPMSGTGGRRSACGAWQKPQALWGST